MDDLIRRSDVFVQSVRWEEINGIGFITVAEDDINAIPAVDAVEVVRCRECIHFEPFRKHDGFCKISTMLYNNDFFCKDGQRREDGDA